MTTGPSSRRFPSSPWPAGAGLQLGRNGLLKKWKLSSGINAITAIRYRTREVHLTGHGLARSTGPPERALPPGPGGPSSNSWARKDCLLLCGFQRPPRKPQAKTPVKQAMSPAPSQTGNCSCEDRKTGCTASNGNRVPGTSGWPCLRDTIRSPVTGSPGPTSRERGGFSLQAPMGIES